jgi:hypothetical protein
MLDEERKKSGRMTEKTVQTQKKFHVWNIFKEKCHDFEKLALFLQIISII